MAEVTGSLSGVGTAVGTAVGAVVRTCRDSSWLGTADGTADASLGTTVVELASLGSLGTADSGRQTRPQGGGPGGDHDHEGGTAIGSLVWFLNARRINSAQAS